MLVKNRKASFEFYIEDKYEAGLVLKSSEVKSIRAGQANINDAFVGIKKGELFLINSHISKYNQASYSNHDEGRYRKILLHKNEVNKIIGKLRVEGYTAIPLSMHLNDRGKIKLEFAIAKGKKLYDKRESIKERQWNREKSRVLRGEK